MISLWYRKEGLVAAVSKCQNSTILILLKYRDKEDRQVKAAARARSDKCFLA